MWTLQIPLHDRGFSSNTVSLLYATVPYEILSLIPATIRFYTLPVVEIIAKRVYGFIIPCAPNVTPASSNLHATDST